jgi:hypothetical protein
MSVGRGVLISTGEGTWVETPKCGKTSAKSCDRNGGNSRRRLRPLEVSQAHMPVIRCGVLGILLERRRELMACHVETETTVSRVCSSGGCRKSTHLSCVALARQRDYLHGWVEVHKAHNLRAGVSASAQHSDARLLRGGRAMQTRRAGGASAAGGGPPKRRAGRRR